MVPDPCGTGRDDSYPVRCYGNETAGALTPAAPHHPGACGRGRVEAAWGGASVRWRGFLPVARGHQPTGRPPREQPGLRAWRTVCTWPYFRGPEDTAMKPQGHTLSALPAARWHACPDAGRARRNTTSSRSLGAHALLTGSLHQTLGGIPRTRRPSLGFPASAFVSSSSRLLESLAGLVWPEVPILCLTRAAPAGPVGPPRPPPTSSRWAPVHGPRRAPWLWVPACPAAFGLEPAFTLMPLFSSFTPERNLR